VFFFDEGRFGLMPSLGKMWVEKDGQPVAVVRISYENFFVYSAVNPDTGEDVTLFLRGVNTGAMNHFLAHMSERLGKRKCLLVMDRAGWHCSKELVVPPNIEIVYLPPYSPELNPVERLWRWLKRHTIRNRLYLAIEEVMDSVQECLNSATPSFLKGLCRCSYL